MSSTLALASGGRRGPPRKRTLLRLVLLTAIGGAGYLGFLSWKAGTPFGDRKWSPNRHYYVQTYNNWKFSSLWFAMPGQGSDGLGGYVRLFDQHDHLLAERFVSFSRDVEPIWDDRQVFLLDGVDEDPPWPLPDSAGQEVCSPCELPGQSVRGAGLENNLTRGREVLRPRKQRSTIK